MFQVVNHYKGANYPIMNLHERTLSVLACKVWFFSAGLCKTAKFVFEMRQWHYHPNIYSAGAWHRKCLPPTPNVMPACTNVQFGKSEYFWQVSVWF